MNRQFAHIYLFVIFILFVVSSAQAQEEILQEKATLFINNYNNKDFFGATRLFHFPQNYTDKKLNEDKDAISKTLKMYFEEFGEITDIEKSDIPPLYYFHMIGGANLSYWQQYSDVSDIFYKVKFSREGQGYLTIVFCNILDKWEIRQVNYGLSADRLDAQIRMDNINKKWNKLMGQ